MGHKCAAADGARDPTLVHQLGQDSACRHPGDVKVLGELALGGEGVADLKVTVDLIQQDTLKPDILRRARRGIADRGNIQPHHRTPSRFLIHPRVKPIRAAAPGQGPGAL